MTNTSPSQSQPFYGYAYHRNPVDLAAMWEMFKTKTAEQIQWEREVYVPGQYQPVPQSWQEREVIKEQNEKENS